MQILELLIKQRWEFKAMERGRNNYSHNNPEHFAVIIRGKML